jgi:hypothetical protein
MTDRDLLTARPRELDKHADWSSLPSQDGVALGCREQFSNLRRIAPARWSSHARNIARRRRERAEQKLCGLVIESVRAILTGEENAPGLARMAADKLPEDLNVRIAELR